MLAIAPAYGEGTAVPVADDEAGTVEGGGDTEVTVPVELPSYEPEVEVHRLLEVGAGYRFVTTDGSGGRAAEYEYLRPSVTGSAHFARLGKDLKLDVDGTYLNSKDYHANLDFDYAGYYRLDFRTESLFHNLDHETYALSPALFTDSAPAERYGITTRQDAFHFRYKLRDYPIHLNLSHWLIDREGSSQQRFSDYTFDAILQANNKLFSQTRRIDRTTQEGTIGLDAHLGPVNLVYQFQFRQSDERGGTPSDLFSAQQGPSEHNEAPESRFYSHSVKLYSSLAGGATGAASYAYSRSENRSSLSSVVGADQARDTLQNVAGDFSYAPCAWFSTAVRYRHQEVDRERPASLLVSSLSGGTVDVRPLFDTVRDIVSANATIRPSTILSVNGEYRGSFLRRDGVTDGAWNLPEESTTHSGTMTLLLRPFKGLRLRGLYGYSTTDNPSYGITPEQQHEGQLLASYSRDGRWGVTANYQITRAWNDSIARTTHPFNGSPSITYVLPSDRHTVHSAAGVWVSPLERLTLSGHVGFLRNRSDQAVLFASVFNGNQAASDYISQGELYSLNATYRAADTLDLSLALQELHSRAEFKPAALTDGGVSTAGITELSRVRTIERSLSARANYWWTKHFSCVLDYSYRDYDNRTGTSNEGTVHVVSASLKTKW
ncbi:hypothetical protein [Geobacter pickeringii]|nr:hypothetical protein [Geobacter pickeringii]